MQKDLQDAFTELNINIPAVAEEEDPFHHHHHHQQEEEYLLPEWKDITSFLDQATQDFDVGQLVRLPSFTLFDAMSAIEIMDPRMDTGMLVEEKEVTVPYDIMKRLKPETVLGIMDRLVTREMAWISGHSLSQTVYTCIYFHHIQQFNTLPMPTLTSNKEDILFGVLKTYVLATVKTCYYIWTEMTQGNIFEEEDFTTNLFGLSFNHQNPDVMVFNDLDSSIMLLQHLLNTNLSDDHAKVVKEILNRMEILKSFLLSIIYLAQNEASHLSQAKNELSKILKLFDSVDLSLGQQDKAAEDAFDSNINRKLASQTPPRPVELVSEKQSFINFRALVTRLCSICDVTDCPSVTSLMNYFLKFGSAKPYPDAFSRSKLNTIFFHNQHIFGTLSIPHFILSSVEETVHPPMWWLSATQKIPSDKDEKELLLAHETLKSFLDRISMVFVEFFKINCHNRSRQRRMLCKVVVEWEILQEEAAGVDEVFHNLQEEEEYAPYYFSSWAYNIKLGMIEKILFLGFELDLYGHHEYIMIYWYLTSVLRSRAYLLERISTYMDSSQETVYDRIRAQQLLIHAKKNLTEAVLKMLQSANYSKQWNQRTLVFDNEKTRYLHRFKPFANLMSPSHPTYEVFLAAVTVKELDVNKLKEIIKRDLNEAKKGLENVLHMSTEETNTEMCSSQFKEEMKNLVRTIVANNIALSYIGKADIKSINAIFKYHSWFPVITTKK